MRFPARKPYPRGESEFRNSVRDTVCLYVQLKGDADSITDQITCGERRLELIESLSCQAGTIFNNQVFERLELGESPERRVGEPKATRKGQFSKVREVFQMDNSLVRKLGAVIQIEFTDGRTVACVPQRHIRNVVTVCEIERAQFRHGFQNDQTLTLKFRQAPEVKFPQGLEVAQVFQATVGEAVVVT